MDPALVGKHDIMTRHESVWYPEARDLSGVLSIVHRLRHAIGVPLELGGVLLTRIPAGKQVFEHDDIGSWHAHYYDCKVWTILKGNDSCINYVEDESMTWHVGDCWQHDNLLKHKVQNFGESDRICLITCFKRIT